MVPLFLTNYTMVPALDPIQPILSTPNIDPTWYYFALDRVRCRVEPNPFIALTFLLHRFGSEDSVILQKDFSILRTLMNYWFLMEMCTMMPIFLRLVHVVVIRTTDLMGPSLMTIASRWQNFWAPSTLACCCSFSRIIHCPVHLMWLFHYGIKKRERIHMLYSYADWCSLLLLRSNPDPLPWVRFLEPHRVDHLMII